MADLLRAVTQVVQDVIDEWDPYTLLALGCPPDEYESEVADIVRALGDCKDEEEAAEAIQEVFERAFGSRLRLSKETCRAAARQIWTRLREMREAPI